MPQGKIRYLIDIGLKIKHFPGFLVVACFYRRTVSPKVYRACSLFSLVLFGSV